MKGRKPIFNPETLKIGGRMQILGKRKKFGHQIAYGFNKRDSIKDTGKQFKCITEGTKVFIERTL